MGGRPPPRPRLQARRQSRLHSASVFLPRTARRCSRSHSATSGSERDVLRPSRPSRIRRAPASRPSPSTPESTRRAPPPHPHPGRTEQTGPIARSRAPGDPPALGHMMPGALTRQPGKRRRCSTQPTEPRAHHSGYKCREREYRPREPHSMERISQYCATCGGRTSGHHIFAVHTGNLDGVRIVVQTCGVHRPRSHSRQWR